MSQGSSFHRTTGEAWPSDGTAGLSEETPYPLAVAVAAAGHGVPLAVALPAYLHAVAANLVSAAVRLVPLGQTDGQRIVAALEPAIADLAARALQATLDDLGGFSFRADIASMRHETQDVRLFRT